MMEYQLLTYVSLTKPPPTCIVSLFTKAMSCFCILLSNFVLCPCIYLVFFLKCKLVIYAQYVKNFLIGLSFHVQLTRGQSHLQLYVSRMILTKGLKKTLEKQCTKALVHQCCSSTAVFFLSSQSLVLGLESPWIYLFHNQLASLISSYIVLRCSLIAADAQL